MTTGKWFGPTTGSCSACEIIPATCDDLNLADQYQVTVSSGFTYFTTSENTHFPCTTEPCALFGGNYVTDFASSNVADGVITCNYQFQSDNSCLTGPGQFGLGGYHVRFTVRYTIDTEQATGEIYIRIAANRTNKSTFQNQEGCTIYNGGGQVPITLPTGPWTIPLAYSSQCFTFRQCNASSPADVLVVAV